MNQYCLLFKTAIRFALFFFVVSGVNLPGFGQEMKSRDGRLLQGEPWQPFVPVEKADFYVAKMETTAWSGTLAEPNSAKTDGPFATLKRAQQAVRELKAKVYFPKRRTG